MVHWNYCENLVNYRSSACGYSKRNAPTMCANVIHKLSVVLAMHAVEERSRMRSIDDIIDKWNTSSVQPEDEDDDQSVREAKMASDNGCAGEVVPMTTTTSHPQHAHIDRPRSTSDSRASVDVEPLWKMFGSPLSQLCRRLLEDLACEQSTAIDKSESQPKDTAAVCGTTKSVVAVACVPKNVPSQSAGVQPLLSSVDVQTRNTSQVGHSIKSHKPPLPTKPSLPPKPLIAKKPSFGKDTSAGVLRNSSSSTSSTSTAPQRQTRSTSSQQSGSACVTVSPLTTSVSAPTSPIVRLTQHDASHQLQQSRAQGARRTHSAVTSRTSPLITTDKTKPATTHGGHSASDRRSSPVRVASAAAAPEAMKSTKSEEFLARIHRRSVSPSGTPRLVARSCRGRSVDLSAASDTSTGVGRRTLSKEWAVLTTTTQEEVTVVYRPPASTSTPDTVDVDALRTSAGDQEAVDKGCVDTCGGGLYKTAIDNIRLSSTTTRPTADSGSDGVRRQSAGGRSLSNDSGVCRVQCGGEPVASACQLDELISSLIEMSAEVEPSQSLQSSSLRHSVVPTAQY